MSCLQHCGDCKCEHASLKQPIKNVYEGVDKKLAIMKDYACLIAQTSCVNLAKVMSQYAYFMWCLLVDLYNMIKCLYDRTDTIREIDTKNNNAILDYIDKMSDFSSKVSTASNKGSVFENNEVAVLGGYNTYKTGSVKYYDFTVVSKLESVSNLDRPIKWNSNTYIEFNGQNRGADATLPLNVGTSYYIRNVSTYDGGKPMHLRLTVKSVAPTTVRSSGYTTNIRRNAVTNAITITNSDGATNTLIEFIGEDGSTPITIITSLLIGDVDHYQMSGVTFSGGNYITLNPQGSALANHNGKLYANTGATSNNDIDGFNFAPLATYAVVGKGSNFNYFHSTKSTDGGATYIEDLYQYDLFGDSGSFDQFVKPAKPTLTPINFNCGV